MEIPDGTLSNAERFTVKFPEDELAKTEVTLVVITDHDRSVLKYRDVLWVGSRRAMPPWWQRVLWKALLGFEWEACTKYGALRAAIEESFG